jgi:RNA 3'-terminal phosphate cyclase
MIRLVSGGAVMAVIATTVVVGCKGETKTVPDPQTEADLKKCLEAKAEKEKLIATLSDENAKLMRDQGSGAEIVVSIEGNALTVKPAKPGEARPIDDKVAGEASKQFIDVVAKSRGAIQKCYEQALKKDSSLQARTITLTVSASFSQAGAYRDASFSPSLSAAFDTCIKTVASRWALPQNSPAMTFKAQVSLTPS